MEEKGRLRPPSGLGQDRQVSVPEGWDPSFGTHFCTPVATDDSGWVRKLKGRFAKCRAIYAHIIDNQPLPPKRMQLAIDCLGIAISTVRSANPKWWKMGPAEANMVEFLLKAVGMLGHETAALNQYEKAALVEPYECCTRLRSVFERIAILCKRYREGGSEAEAVRMYRQIEDGKREVRVEWASAELEAYIRKRLFTACPNCERMRDILLGVMASPEPAMMKLAAAITASDAEDGAVPSGNPGATGQAGEPGTTEAPDEQQQQSQSDAEKEEDHSAPDTTGTDHRGPSCVAENPTPDGNP